MVTDMLFPTSLVGSYPQPDWLIDRDRLSHRLPPRVRARELWRVDPAYLEQAQRDATLLAVRDEERAGLDIVTDGEQVRESYSNRFATALDGVDLDHPGTLLGRTGIPNPVPRITGPVRRRHPVETGDVAFLRASTDRTVKMTVPGPFTMAQQAQDDYYANPVHLCFGYAAIVADRPEGYSFLPELAACDCDQVSIETAQANLDTSVLRSLDSKTIILGVLNLGDETVETPDVVVARVRRALEHVPAERLILAPDCGMKYLPRDSAYGKLTSMTAAAAQLRAEA